MAHATVGVIHRPPKDEQVRPRWSDILAAFALLDAPPAHRWPDEMVQWHGGTRRAPGR
jgi:hypothetical protein